MKKISCFILVLAIFLYTDAYALDNNQLLDMRNNIFDESKDIKPLLANSKDVVLLNNMWDSCMIAITQLDAYFFMMGIFDSVSKDKWNEEAVNYMELWLNKIKGTNELNLKGLNGLRPSNLEPKTQLHVEKLKVYFTDLNKAVEEGLSIISKLKNSVAAKK